MPRLPDWDPVRAWRFLRASRGYRADWRRRRPQPGLIEPAPFEIRWQTAGDVGALRWGLHAWADPLIADGPVSPFWARGTLMDGRVERNGLPLTELAAAGQAVLTGLRVGGTLILKIEREDSAVQVRVASGEAFPVDGRLLLVREVDRIEDVWSGVPGPASGRGRGTGTRNCCSCWPVRPRGMSRREIAIAIWGADRVAGEYFPGCWMQSRIKRRLDWAKAIVKHYREIATGIQSPLDRPPAGSTPHPI